MNSDRDKQHLLRDILDEESDPGLREALFGQTLRLVRREGHFRAVRRAGSFAVILVLAGLLAWHFARPGWPSTTLPQPRAEAGYALIHTQPLDPAVIVCTPSSVSSPAIASLPFRDIVTTEDSRPAIVELTDDQLLALAKGAPVALVRRGPHEAELVFANDGDREKLFHN
jgi:hypothetical protein